MVFVCFSVGFQNGFHGFHGFHAFLCSVQHAREARQEARRLGVARRDSERRMAHTAGFALRMHAAWRGKKVPNKPDRVRIAWAALRSATASHASAALRDRPRASGGTVNAQQATGRRRFLLVHQASAWRFRSRHTRLAAQ